MISMNIQDVDEVVNFLRQPTDIAYASQNTFTKTLMTFSKENVLDLAFGKYAAWLAGMRGLL